MPSYHWIKLYHEILGDPKMGRLPDHLWRRCIECFLMAGQKDEGGFLPTTEDMAWMLRADTDQVAGDMNALALVGIVEERDGRWFVVHFAERQAAVPGAERVAQHRERQRKREYYEPETKQQQPCNAPVTERYTDKIRVDKSREEESVREVEFEQAATPPEPAAPPAAKKRTKEPKPPDPPGVQVYRANTGRNPPKALYDDIARIVGSDAAFWAQVVKGWIGIGRNPANVSGMLECFERREVPCTKPTGGSNGTNRQPNPRSTGTSWARRDGFTGDDIARILAEREAEEAAQQARGATCPG